MLSNSYVSPFNRSDRWGERSAGRGTRTTRLSAGGYVNLDRLARIVPFFIDPEQLELVLTRTGVVGNPDTTLFAGLRRLRLGHGAKPMQTRVGTIAFDRLQVKRDIRGPFKVAE